MGQTDASDSRLIALTRWLEDDLGFGGADVAPASADASFRRYFRVTRGVETYIVMDAPPDKEDVGPFVDIARLLAGMGLNVPIVLAQHRGGFLLLSDLGSQLYLPELEAQRDVDRLYGDALDALVALQTSGTAAARTLPAYDDGALRREMQLFPEWFLARHLGLALEAHERQLIDDLFDRLITSAASQPQAFVHRDYHSRNLLLTVRGNPGILDFQDAVCGPITYDAVSLLKDCYIAWPTERVSAWLVGYQDRLRAAGMEIPGGSVFERWFDLMGLQRHIKVLGIFARLFYRDGKPGYLKDLPRVFDYVRETAGAYAETAEFLRWLDGKVAPLFRAAQSRLP